MHTKTITLILAMMLGASQLSVAHAESLKERLRQLLEHAKPKPAQEQQAPVAGQESEVRIPPVGSVPLEDEVKLGRQISGNLLGAAPLVKDDKLQQYVNKVGRWVALHSDRPDLKWIFGVIESNDINAFAAPGGYVFITRGLYIRLKDESELAGVLGHEVAHVQEKHHLKVVQKSQLLGVGATVAQATLGKGKSGVQRLIGSGAEILSRGLDKDAEYEADRIGVVIAARAGYDVWGLPSVLQEISAVSSTDSTVGMLFKTHPHPDDRLARLADSMGDRLDGLPETGNGKGRFYSLAK